MNDEDFELIESRLSAEARRLGAAAAGRPSASGLASEFHRRARRRLWTRTICAASAAGLLAALWAFSVRGPAIPRRDFAGGVPQPAPLVTADEALARRDSQLLAIPVLIASHTEDGQPLVVTGWYIPEQAAALDLLDVSDAELEAAGRLPVPDAETIEVETI